MKKKQVLEPYTGQLWPLGTHVHVLRPNLWAGMKGEVTAVDEKRGVHRVRVVVVRGSFDVEALGDQLHPI